MLIRKIELLNFRQFQDRVSLEFADDIEKNVTVIMGDNGSGKTTFAQAFIWCLYGENEFKVKELINRQIKENMKSGDRRKVEVSLQVNVEEKEYRIVRRQTIQKVRVQCKSVEEEFFVEFQNEETGETEYMAKQKSDTFVKRMLPKELSRFFFFDGERIKNMSEEVENGKSREFANAVEGLVGLTSLRNAKNHLFGNNGVIKKYQDEVAKTSGDKYQEYAEKIDKIDQELNQNSEKISKLEEDIAFYYKTAGEKSKEIKEMSSAVELRKKYDTKQEELQKLEDDKQSEIQRVLEEFSQKAKYFFLMPLAKDALQEIKAAPKVEKGIPRLHSDTIRYLLKRKRCICGEQLQEGDSHMQELYRLLEVVPPKTTGQIVHDYTETVKNDTEVVRNFYDNYLGIVKNIADKTQRIEEIIQWLRETDEKLADTSAAKSLKQEKDYAETTAQKLSLEKAKLLERNGELKKERGYDEKQRDKYINMNESNRMNRRLLEYARLVYEDIEKEYGEKEDTVRRELESTINEIFREIYDSGIQLSVDEKYNIRVSVNEVSEIEDELERNTAQNYAIIFAFISGIIKLSKNKRAELNELYGLETTEEGEKLAGYPLVMDAPLSAFDKRRIENICETIPDIAQQVVMFIKDTDGEVAEHYMDSRIGKRYLLVADSKIRTHIEGRQ